MFVSYKVLALVLALLGVCYSFDLPDVGRRGVKDSDVDKLLSAVRVLVTGIENTIKSHESRLDSLYGNIQSLSKMVGSTDRNLSVLQNRINNAHVACQEKRTAWTPYSDAYIKYLDRQDVTCPQGYFLSRFRLIRQADLGNAPVRYLFRCCKLVI